MKLVKISTCLSIHNKNAIENNEAASKVPPMTNKIEEWKIKEDKQNKVAMVNATGQSQSSVVVNFSQRSCHIRPWPLLM